MDKIWIIIQREYWVRVTQKTFLLTTILTPLGIILLSILPIISAKFTESDKLLHVQVIDKNKLVIEKLVSNEDVKFIATDKSFEDEKKHIKDNPNEAILLIPEDFSRQNINFSLYITEKISMKKEMAIRSKLKEIVRDYKLTQAGIAKEQLKNSDFDMSLNSIKLLEEGEESTSSALGAAAGYLMAMLIYIFIIIYGTWVMRGVIEEKTSRVIEIIISSVKPFQLMLGKIIGIAAVGLTQFIIWCFLILLFTWGISFFIDTSTAVPAGNELTMKTSEAQAMQKEILSAVYSFKWSLIFYFIFYFIGGYLLYGSLFAAIGAMIDNESDAGQFTIIVILPLMIPLSFISSIIQSPNGPIAIFGSIFPLFSPIVMMVRLASVDVAWWQILLSMISLIGGFLFSGWLAGRIYRAGILMYGKKMTIKEGLKWIFFKPS